MVTKTMMILLGIIAFGVSILGVIGMAHAVETPQEDGIESSFMFSVINLNFTNSTNFPSGTPFNLEHIYESLGIMYSEKLGGNYFDSVYIGSNTEIRYSGLIVDGITDGVT